MKINIEKLLGKEATDRLCNLGLHKIAAARLRSEGHQVPTELDMHSAIQALGTNVYHKNAEYKGIIEGLATLDDLMKSAGLTPASKQPIPSQYVNGQGKHPSHIYLDALE